MAIRRIGMVIGVKEERLSEYRELHSDSHSGVRDLLSEANIHDFTIFLTEMPDGKPYLFGYYEYHGKNYEADMAHLAEEPRNAEWLAMTDPMQIPLPGEAGWKFMEEVYHNP